MNDHDYPYFSHWCYHQWYVKIHLGIFQILMFLHCDWDHPSVSDVERTGDSAGSVGKIASYDIGITDETAYVHY